MFVLRLNDSVLTFVISNRTQSPRCKAVVLYIRLSVSLATLLLLLFQVPELVFSDLVHTLSNRDTRRSIGAKSLSLYSPCVANKVQVNLLTPNDDYSGRTAPLTSKRCILYIYSTNTGTEYFKHGIYSPYFLFKMQFVS